MKFTHLCYYFYVVKTMSSTTRDWEWLGYPTFKNGELRNGLFLF